MSPVVVCAPERSTSCACPKSADPGSSVSKHLELWYTMDPLVEDTPVELILSSVITKETQLIKDVESLMIAVGKDGNIKTCLQKVLDGLSDFIEIYRKVPQKCFKTFHKCLKYLQRHKNISVKTSVSYKIGNLYFQYEKPLYGMKYHSKVIEDILKNPKKNVALNLENYILTMSRFGKAEEAYQKIQALYRTNKGHSYNLAICLTELGELDNALSYIDLSKQDMDMKYIISKTEVKSGIISTELKRQMAVDIIMKKGDYKKAHRYSETVGSFICQNIDLNRAIEYQLKLTYLTWLFKEGCCAFEENDLVSAYHVFQQYIKELMKTCVAVKYNVALIRDAILRIPKIYSMIQSCLFDLESEDDDDKHAKHAKKCTDRLNSWRGILDDVDFDLKNDLPMDGILKALMYHSVICSCMTPGAIIDFEEYNHLILELYEKLGWYEEIERHSCNGYEHVNHSLMTVNSIQSMYRMVDVFLKMGHIHDAE